MLTQDCANHFFFILNSMIESAVEPLSVRELVTKSVQAAAAKYCSQYRNPESAYATLFDMLVRRCNIKGREKLYAAITDLFAGKPLEFSNLYKAHLPRERHQELDEFCMKIGELGYVPSPTDTHKKLGPIGLAQKELLKDMFNSGKIDQKTYEYMLHELCKK